ncbi:MULTISPECIES: Maf family protein [Alteromonadaceae]|uniref:dTTP/UTP pyrophosphatase n=1 Tax=Brumicola blandensis TaxID=3075611 RepID=A0AAW8QYY8_9ALTE|nr:MULTISPECIES: Maf family protein [unclassified Alteromonas]MDT0582252.1 Maf family protein [Alteromonas sp. W409]MDT0627792.1 Maf family protein [Alteromonas sp. W364]
MSLCRVILASASPRRKELLQHLIPHFDIISADVDETPLADESPERLVARLAEAKATKVATHHPDKLVIGADTIVTFGDQIFGKPENQNDSIRMLSMLSSQTHQVITAVAFRYQNKSFVEQVKTQVTFACLNEQDMRNYWQSGEPQDKAGSYAIQGIGGQFVKSIKGSHSNVVGLPLYETKVMLNKIGYLN